MQKTSTAYLEQHEFIERLIPLHKEHPRMGGTTQIAIAIVRVATDCTSHTPFRVWDFCSHGKFPEIKKCKTLNFLLIHYQSRQYYIMVEHQIIQNAVT